MTELIDTAASGHRGQVLAALMVATGLAALDATIVATAVPSIVRVGGGFSWIFWALVGAAALCLCAQLALPRIFDEIGD